MTKIYLNHSCLMYSSSHQVEEKLDELRALIYELRRRKWILHIIQSFWDIRIEGEALKTYLYGLSDKDTQMASIIAIMDSGPYFETVGELETYPKLEITPEVDDYTFEYPFLYTCFLESQPHIMSFQHPILLTNSAFTLKIEETVLAINNVCGLINFERFLHELNPLMSIQDVFKKIEEEKESLIILPSAKKSANRHNFKGNFTVVYKLLLALHDFELNSNSNEMRESREDYFYRKTGFQISKESTATLDVKRFRQEREFIIPGDGKKIFEWHVKIGNDTRIHYYVNKTDDKIYVGHCGAHLGTVSFNS